MIRRLPVIVAMLLALVGCKQEAHEEAEAPIKYDPVPVRVAAAQKTVLRPTLDLIGTVTAIPEHTAIISPLVGGNIARVSVVEGQMVKAGDEIVTLDPRLAEAELGKLAAAVDEKAAVVARLKRGYLPQEIDTARHDVAKFQANVESLKTKLAGLSTLREKDEVSAVQFKSAQQAMQSSEAELAAATAKLALLQAGTRPEEIAEAQAKLAGSQAELNAAKLAVQFCHITSPIDGVVTQLAARQGMTVDRTLALATIADQSTLFAQFRVPNTYLGQVRAGAKVEVSLTSVPGEIFQATVTRLSGQADATTGDVDAFATITNDKHLLHPGLGCRVSVALPEIADAIVIPVAAVADRAGTPVVTLVKDNKAKEVEVKLGVQTHNVVQVLEGLAPGDLVATENGYGLPNDCPVKIIDDKQPAGAAAKP